MITLEDGGAILLKRYGINSQMIKTIEEMAELTVEIAKAYNCERDTRLILDEIADVTIMIFQLREHFGRDIVDDIIQRKLDRALEVANVKNSP